MIFERDENSKEEDEDDKELAKYYKIFDEPNSSNLDNSIIAITHLSNNDKKIGRDLLNTSVMGYVHVSKFDDDKND